MTMQPADGGRQGQVMFVQYSSTSLTQIESHCTAQQKLSFWQTSSAHGLHVSSMAAPVEHRLWAHVP